VSVRLWLVAAAVIGLVTGCTGSSGGRSGSSRPDGTASGRGAPSPSSTTAAHATATATATKGSASRSGATPGLVTIGLTGDLLTATGGKTLYYNTVDTARVIKCVGACAKAWPPLIGTPRPGAGIDARDLSTTIRPDGGTQVTFRGHPLYEFDEAAQAGDSGGNGGVGGRWMVATLQRASG
jgi:predicted lipoprotein with Yx(FWY)xxD motif